METLTGYLNTVAHPKHYSGKVECIDCIESAVAEWYLSKLMEVQEDNENE